MAKLIRITTVPMALKYLLRGQMKYMKEQGWDVVMVSADGKEREDVVEYEGCRHVILPMTRKITPLADLVSLWKMYRLFKKEKPAIIHSHTPKAGLLAMLAGKLAGIKIRVHTVAGLRFMTATGLTRKVLIRMEKLTGKWATQVLPNSPSLYTYIKDNKLVSPGKMEVIGKGSSNGINLDRFSVSQLNADKLKAAQAVIQYNEQLVYLLCVGRIVKDKGIHELARAFVRLYQKNTSLRLVLVGTFEDKLDPVDEEVRTILATHPGIILAGWSDDVEYFMHLSFALVHPSYREGFPNVLLQAGAMQCPVICSRIEGNIDIVEDEKTGLIFESKNEEALYQRLYFAINNSQILEQYARQLRLTIEQQYNQPVIHSLLHQKYLSLLAAKGIPA